MSLDVCQAWTGRSDADLVRWSWPDRHTHASRHSLWAVTSSVVNAVRREGSLALSKGDGACGVGIMHVDISTVP